MTDPITYHRFDANVATSYGVPAALVFNYIAFRVKYQKDEFITITLPEFYAQYPYMGKWEVRAALKALTRPGRKAPALVNRQLDNGCYSYAINAMVFNPDKGHKFDPDLAVKLGIIPAVIYQNISYWIKRNWDIAHEKVAPTLDPADFDFDQRKFDSFVYTITRTKAYHTGSISDWMELHPYTSFATAKRGFALLLKKKMLTVTHGRRLKPVWELPEKEVAAHLSFCVSGKDLKIRNLKSSRSSSNSHDEAQNHSIQLKITEKQRLSSEVIRLYSAFSEALVNEASVDEAKFLDSDGSHAMIPARFARRDPGVTPSEAASPELKLAEKVLPEKVMLTRTELKRVMNQLNPEVAGKLKSLQCADIPVRKPKVYTDFMGNVCKRTYRWKMNPGDADWDDYVETLPLAEVIAARKREAAYYRELDQQAGYCAGNGYDAAGVEGTGAEAAKAAGTLEEAGSGSGSEVAAATAAGS